MDNTDQVFRLAKVIYDARVEYVNGRMFKERWEAEKAKFPIDLRQHSYVTPQPWIDIALAEAKAAIKFLESENHV